MEEDSPGLGRLVPAGAGKDGQIYDYRYLYETCLFFIYSSRGGGDDKRLPATLIAAWPVVGLTLEG